MCERVAHFLGGSPEERFRTFKDVKRAYEARSKRVHGVGLKREADAIEICKSVDGLLRVILRKVLENPTLRELYVKEDSGAVKTYLDRLIFFGASPGV